MLGTGLCQVEHQRPEFGLVGHFGCQARKSRSRALQAIINQWIGVGMAGDIGRYTQFEAAPALQLAAANTGGRRMKVETGAGAAMAQAMLTSPRPTASPSAPPSTSTVRYCMECGKAIPEGARYCPGCGRAQ